MKTNFDLLKEKVNEMGVEEIIKKVDCGKIHHILGIKYSCNQCKFDHGVNCKTDMLNSPAFELTREQRTELQYMRDCGYKVLEKYTGILMFSRENGSCNTATQKYPFITEKTLLVDLLGGGENG